MVLPTAAVADAAARLHIPVRFAGPGLVPVLPAAAAGPTRFVRHRDSVDVLLQAVDDATPGDVLLVDDRGRRDQACVGDLITLEAREAGMAAIVVWGSHRDTAQLQTIALPVFSLGSHPAAPSLLGVPVGDAGPSRLGDTPVHDGDWVVADYDGVLLVPGEAREAIWVEARRIHGVEQRQAALAERGTSLREQFDFAGYQRAHAADPSYSFRDHLRERGSAIEA